ncbi:MAG TPA: hypothetical protein EYH50_02665 [Pyrodictium delaneyi]|uniref:Uncharacterized protein n=1 Tax=Pyrodictium delaneyi TaxID=1273541 RepID=A0A832ZT14_9CREN|nr:hypothetical protein [Pyrodictium delaneyi]
MRDDHVAQLVRERLRSVAMGALAVLDNRAFASYRVDFATLLVRDPLAAYKVLLSYQKDPRKARVILRSVLLGFSRSALEILNAINALEKGDPKPVKRILKRAADGRAGSRAP